MTLLRKLVSVACWACLLTSYSASINAQNQDPTTGNLINFTGTPTATTGNWVNGVYVNGLTCWQPGGPGNCGPNPNVQTNGNINFSYGAVNLYQVVNINQALMVAGNNLQVTGFNFGFMAKNGNGWDNGQQDYLSAYVKFLKSNGSVAANYDYTQYTNRKYDWTNFLFSETFSNLGLAAGYRAAQVGFIGKDTNNFAGPYGPEITNVSFNLKYRVDPCATDPTSSPTCPGFMAAMNAKTPAPITPVAAPVVEGVTVAPTVSTPSTPANTVDTVKPSTPSRSVAVSTALSTIAKNQQREQAIQNAAVAMATSEAAAAGDRAQQQAVSVAAAAVSMSQTQSNSSGQTQRQSGTTFTTVSASQTSSASPTPSSAPVSNESKSVTVTTTVQAPAPRATTPVVASVSFATTNDTQTSTVPNIQSYFSRAQTSTAVQTTASTSSLPLQPNKSSVTATVTTVVPVTATTTNTPVFSQAATEQQSTVSFAYVQSQSTMFASMAAAPVEQQQQATAQTVSFSRQAEIEQVNNTVGFMTNRTDPLNEVVESKPILTITTTTESTQTVKATVSDNELASGVDINKMALTPVGYNNYTNLMLKDGKMYEPKEIYKNQTPVDNARALRQLSTDRLHQQMIEQQYRR